MAQLKEGSIIKKSTGDEVIATLTYVDSKVQTDVPSGAKFTDTVYTHPASHPASMITESSTQRFVTDAEKLTWNSKSDTDTVTTINGKTGEISKADIVALGISEQGPKGDKGADGIDGQDGAKGDKGDDGHTPIKGTDYWTTADQAAIVADVLAALPDGDGVDY